MCSLGSAPAPAAGSSGGRSRLRPRTPAPCLRSDPVSGRSTWPTGGRHEHAHAAQIAQSVRWGHVHPVPRRRAGETSRRVLRRVWRGRPRVFTGVSRRKERPRMGIGASIVLIAAGAILRFAVTLHSDLGSAHVNWNIVGDVLMVVGALGLLMALALDGRQSSRRCTVADSGYVRAGRPADCIVAIRRPVSPAVRWVARPSACQAVTVSAQVSNAPRSRARCPTHASLDLLTRCRRDRQTRLAIASACAARRRQAVAQLEHAALALGQASAGRSHKRAAALGAGAARSRSGQAVDARSSALLVVAVGRP